MYDNVFARQRSKLIEDFGSLETAMEKNEAVSTVKAIFPVVRDEGWEPGTSLKLRLLLSARQLVVENYPLPLDGVREKFQGFQLTKEEYKEVTGQTANGIKSVFRIRTKLATWIRIQVLQINDKKKYNKLAV